MTVRADKLILALAFCPDRPKHCRLAYRIVYAAGTFLFFNLLDPWVFFIAFDITSSRFDFPIVENVEAPLIPGLPDIRVLGIVFFFRFRVVAIFCLEPSRVKLFRFLGNAVFSLSPLGSQALNRLGYLVLPASVPKLSSINFWRFLCCSVGFLEDMDWEMTQPEVDEGPDFLGRI